MPARKKAERSAKEEQLRLLRQILAELQALNANLAAGRAGAQTEAGRPARNDDSGDEELEEYE